MAQVLVRGLHKATCVAMLAAIGANILQHATALLAQPASAYRPGADRYPKVTRRSRPQAPARP